MVRVGEIAVRDVFDPVVCLRSEGRVLHIFDVEIAVVADEGFRVWLNLDGAVDKAK